MSAADGEIWEWPCRMNPYALWTTEGLNFDLLKPTHSQLVAEKFLLARDDIPARLWMSSYADLLPHRRVQKRWCANELPSYPCCQFSDSPSSSSLLLNCKCSCFPAALREAQSICNSGIPPEGKVLASCFKLSCLFTKEEGRKYQSGHWCNQTEQLKWGQYPFCHQTTQAVLLPGLSRPVQTCCHHVTSMVILLGSATCASAPLVPLSIHYLAPSKQYQI